MRGCWRSWVALLSRRERGTTLAAFRIAVAMVMLATLLSVAWSGAVEPLWLEPAHGGMRPIRYQFFILQWLGGARPNVVWPLLSFACVAAITMAVGWGGRWSVLVAALAYRSLSTIGAGSGGYDNMIANASWLLFLGDCTATLSIDCRRRTGKWSSDERISAWPRFLVIGQLVLIYTATGLQKTSASWTFVDGYSALYWFLQDPTWIRFDMGWTGPLYPVTQAMTFIVWHFEVSAVVILLILYYRRTASRPGKLRALFNRRDLRIGWATMGISMHLGIALLMNMGPFSWISLAYYLCLVPPRSLQRWAASLSFMPLRRYSRSH